jgi:hypothetical protein
MSRSISYSRYFRMPTPIDTGSAATPNQARPMITSSVFGPPEVLKDAPRNRQMIVTAAPLASHFSCWRRSPLLRRQLSACRAMKASDSPMITTVGGPWTALNQPTG